MVHLRALESEVCLMSVRGGVYLCLLVCLLLRVAAPKTDHAGVDEGVSHMLAIFAHRSFLTTGRCAYRP